MRGARLALLASLAACTEDGEQESRPLHELEGLDFVPPAECFLWPSTDLSLTRAIVIDRFEFTRADLRHYWPDRPSRAQTIRWQTDPGLDSQPPPAKRAARLLRGRGAR